MTIRDIVLRALSAAALAALAAACSATSNPDNAVSEEALSAVVNVAVSGPCADGAPAQTFAGGMVGCAGSVAWADRAALCAEGYHVASANDWAAARTMAVPSHDYWTNDNLGFAGNGSSSCSATLTGGTSCGDKRPMRVCTPYGSPAGTDAEGNHCTWTGCGLDSNANQFFGGCVTNATAGTLCVPDGCVDGTEEDVFSNGMVGCAGAMSYANRKSLCAVGYRPATASEWVANRKLTFLGLPGTPTVIDSPPSHDYWTDDALHYNGSASSCYVDFQGGPCTGTPMRVCTPNGSDAEGNTCTWTNCSDGNGSPNAYFGGCATNPTAGTLCIPAVQAADSCTQLPSDPCRAVFHLTGWITRRASFDSVCPAGSKTGEAWLAQLKDIFAHRALPSAKDDLEASIRNFVVRGMTHAMFAGTEAFCVHTLYDNAYYTALNQGPTAVPPGASGAPFAAESANGAVLAICWPALVGGVIEDGICLHPEVGGCPKCLATDLPADVPTDLPP